MNTKAKELVDKFYYALPNNGLQVGVNNVNSRWEEAKKCALIAQQKAIYNLKQVILNMSIDDKCYEFINELLDEEYAIRNEIDKL